MPYKYSSNTKELNRLLAQFNQEGGFSASILTDSQGLAIAFAGKDGPDAGRQSAIVSMIQKTISQAGERLGLESTDEISFYDTSGQRLVCRPFKVDSYSLILAVSIPNAHISYRRITNQAILAISHLWQEQVK